jgi:GTP-binding protein EngB required for normal cell division
MSQPTAHALKLLNSVIHQFKLESLLPALRACETLSGKDAFLDVAVLGQFKSGKSSLLNALLRDEVFPVSVLPATAVITRTVAGPNLAVRVHQLDGTTIDISPEQIGDFVTEAGNPRNRRNVAVVDVFTPAMQEWPGIRLVDTPGLGSVFLHNTEATRLWMPNVAVALVTVSAERPLSDEDSRLISDARTIAGRVVVVLTKVDILSHDERLQMISFMDAAIREKLGVAVPILPFSIRRDQDRWFRQFQEMVLHPIVSNVEGERQSALRTKLSALAHSCRDYLSVGLQAAEQADADRESLRKAVLDESVKAGVVLDELRIVERRMHEGTRPAFEGLLFPRQAMVTERIVTAIKSEFPTWHGNLAEQAQRSEVWMKDRLNAELTPLSREAIPLATELMDRAVDRLQRVVEAFRNRLRHNIQEAMGLTVSPATWTIERPGLTGVPVAVSRTFMLSWEMLSWLLPMRLFGGMFRRHVIRRVPWEVQKNLTRLVGDWTEAVNAAVTNLRRQAGVWVDTELSTLDRLLAQQPLEASAFRAAIVQLEGAVQSL